MSALSLQQQTLQYPPWLDQVAEIMRSYNVPAHTWLPIVELESHYNPGIVNSNGGAKGLFQIYPIHTDIYPYAGDPVASARWAAPRMADAIRRTGSTNALTVAINSDWPGNDPRALIAETRRWIANFNAEQQPNLDNPNSTLNQYINYVIGGVETPHIPPPNGSNPNPTPQPIQGTESGLPNVITFPETTIIPGQQISPGSTITYPGGSFQIPPISTQPIKFNPTGLVNVGGRIFLSMVAVGFIAFGIISIVWDKTPEGVKQEVKDMPKMVAAA